MYYIKEKYLSASKVYLSLCSSSKCPITSYHEVKKFNFSFTCDGKSCTQVLLFIKQEILYYKEFSIITLNLVYFLLSPIYYSQKWKKQPFLVNA